MTIFTTDDGDTNHVLRLQVPALRRRTKIVVAIVTVAATVAWNLCRDTFDLPSPKDVRPSAAQDPEFDWFEVSNTLCCEVLQLSS